MIKRIKWLLWDSGKDSNPTPREVHNFAVGMVIGTALNGIAWAIIFLVVRY